MPMMRGRSRRRPTRWSGRGEASTLLRGNDLATATVRKIAPACQCFSAESSANRAAQQTSMRLNGARPEILGGIRNGLGIACPLWLERSSVEKPDGQRADRDDAEEDQHERDVRLTLGIVLRETVHLPTCKARRTLWSCGGSNPGPNECDSCALPAELQPRTRPIDENDTRSWRHPPASAVWHEPCVRACGESSPRARSSERPAAQRPCALLAAALGTSVARGLVAGVSPRRGARVPWDPRHAPSPRRRHHAVRS